jgi:hypothetical protein
MSWHISQSSQTRRREEKRREEKRREEKRREGDPKEWSTVLINALGSWEKSVPRGHQVYQWLRP